MEAEQLSKEAAQKRLEWLQEENNELKEEVGKGKEPSQ